MEYYVNQNWDLDQVLPWEHLQGPLPVATLKKHLADSLSGS